MKLLTFVLFIGISVKLSGQIQQSSQVGASSKDSLAKYRLAIDSIDNQIIYLLSVRMGAARNIGIIKKQNNMPVEQPGRWEELLKRLKQLATNKGLDTVFILDIYNRIHTESKKLQATISN